MLSNVHLHTSLLLPLWRDSFNRNKIIAYDVRYSPADLLQLDVKTLRYRLFTANDALSADEPRLHLKGIHLNKCPAIAPLTTLDAASIERLHLDVAQCQHHAEQLRQARPAIVEKLIQIFQQPDYADSDVEHQLYHGFFNDDDKEKIRKVQQTPPAQLARMKLDFFDARLPALLFRYRARNAPDSLNLAEQQQWNEFCRQRLSQKTGGGNITLAEYFQQIQQLRAENPQIEQQKLLDELQSHGEMLANRYGIEL
jgi:exodeoxyribonuclease-1